MKTPMLGKSRSGAVALALIIGSLHGPSAIGQDGGPTTPTPPKGKKWDYLFHNRKSASQGTLGYGPPGLHPGFQGFGLGYHPGYGFGGAALGVGDEGGYPRYGGPGYPHPAPALSRLGGITPFCYYGGPGGPTPDQPHFFGGVGPLAPDSPVVTIPSDSPYEGNYGPFTGSIPYPESTFAPFATRAAGDSSEGSRSGPSQSPAQTPPRTQPPAPSPAPSTSTSESIPGSMDARGTLGVDTDPVVDAGSARGLKVTFVQPSSAAEKAGLKVGDVIRSANGFLTEQPGHLSWVLLNASPDKILTLNILAAKDGEVHTITARRP